MYIWQGGRLTFSFISYIKLCSLRHTHHKHYKMCGHVNNLLSAMTLGRVHCIKVLVDSTCRWPGFTSLGWQIHCGGTKYSDILSQSIDIFHFSYEKTNMYVLYNYSKIYHLKVLYDKMNSYNTVSYNQNINTYSPLSIPGCKSQQSNTPSI